jgi:hypothetical protein
MSFPSEIDLATNVAGELALDARQSMTIVDNEVIGC